LHKRSAYHSFSFFFLFFFFCIPLIKLQRKQQKMKIEDLFRGNFLKYVCLQNSKTEMPQKMCLVRAKHCKHDKCIAKTQITKKKRKKKKKERLLVNRKQKTQMPLKSSKVDRFKETEYNY